ncbi:MAG: circularly permuted type 2 ATP-grasp protein [Rhodocyclaceae bacterium]|nr:circularly permuted type 2 ATP-grasp protein [Rhodocyclaceae bacterium]MBX3669744.1 circularly permuted type 2 ATP-grasp protein [Rhodocyclaceae bacterium]
MLNPPEGLPKDTPRYDEMMSDGAPRQHWAPLWEEISALSAEALADKLRYIERQIREDGVTFNMYADPQGTGHPWELDALPLILSPEEWESIESGIVQRADLMNRILADAYGEQWITRERLVPPALLHGHAGYLRPAHGVKPPGGIYLHIYSADLVRAPDGRWCVVADRTQSPSGAGYALENRVIVSRAFPNLFKELQIEHLAMFFGALRDSLAHFAPKSDEAPRTVLLTPGPYNETYFEHTYLARYLGFPLVEGHDLTVRDGCVWLKTLSGLQRVHAILRRQDDEFCDPLELRSDSALGVAGLTDCARRGNVLIANALGSNIMESGAWFSFLPKICQQMLGESLKLPSVRSWWCGDPAALDEVEANLDDLVFKPAFPQRRFDPIFGRQLDAVERAKLIARVRERPADYVAQDAIALSHAPVLNRHHPKKMQSRVIGLRVFACATPNGYLVMPGGLTRAAGAGNERIISMQRGGQAKDTWVMTRGQVNTFSMLRRRIQAQDLVRSGANLSSRVVENLFWFGRYMERSENGARLLRLALARLVDYDPSTSLVEWPAILAVCRAVGIKLDESDPSDPKLQAAIMRAIYDDRAESGLASSLQSLFNVAFSLRERLSVDNWRTINRLLQELAHVRKQNPSFARAIASLDAAVVAIMTLSGFTLDGMTRDQGWRFLSLGRRLERLQFLCIALTEAVEHAHEDGLEWLLELADSIVTYRSRYVSRPEWLPVLDLLVTDESNPRSMAFQIYGVSDYIQRLSRYLPGADSDMLRPLVDRLDALDPAQNLAPDDRKLLGLLWEGRRTALDLSDFLGLRYFSHVDTPTLQLGT